MFLTPILSLSVTAENAKTTTKQEKSLYADPDAFLADLADAIQIRYDYMEEKVEAEDQDTLMIEAYQEESKSLSDYSEQHFEDPAFERLSSAYFQGLDLITGSESLKADNEKAYNAIIEAGQLTYFSALYGFYTSYDLELNDSVTAEFDDAIDISYADADFIEDLSQALQNRWKTALNYNKDIYDFDTYKQYLQEALDAEKEALVDYRQKHFEDVQLQEYAFAYMNCIDNRQKVLDSSEEDTFSSDWDKLNSKWVSVIYNVYQNYDLKVDSRYNEQLNQVFNFYYSDLLGATGMFNLLNQHMMDEIDFDYVTIEESENSDRFRFIITNTTEYEFKDFEVTLYITDSSNNTLIGEPMYYTIGDWKPGTDAVLLYETSEKYRSDAMMTLTLRYDR